MLLELKKEIIYGPVQSRRLGRSLGINLLPAEQKICTFDCLYCQYGWTNFTKMETANFPTVSNVLSAVNQALGIISPPPQYITFSGNGEPTLHPQFPEIVDELIRLRDRHAHGSQTAILSNSTRVQDPKIQAALKKLDVRIMKLDTGTESCLNEYNKPCRGIELEAIIRGLSSLEEVTIQSLFTKGPSGNFEDSHVSAWTRAIKRISPIHVQIYTLDRGVPSRRIDKLDKDELDRIHSRLQNENIHSEVYWRD